jgi:predicted nuclease with TOPRIM domain
MAKRRTLTQADVDILKKEVSSAVLKAVVPQIKTAVSLVITTELSQQKEKYEKKLEEFKSEFFDRVDPILKEVVANREERTIMAHYITEFRDRVEKIEKQLGMAA